MAQQTIGGRLFRTQQEYTRPDNPMLDVNNDHAIRRPRNPELSRYVPSPTRGYSPPASGPAQRNAPPAPAPVKSPMQPVPFAPLLPGTGDFRMSRTAWTLPFPMASPDPGPPTPAPAPPLVGMGDARLTDQNDYSQTYRTPAVQQYNFGLGMSGKQPYPTSPPTASFQPAVQGGNPMFNMALPLQLTPGVMGAGMVNLAGSFGKGFARDQSNVNKYEMMNGEGSASSGPWDARAVRQQQSEAFAGQLPYPGSSQQAGLMTGTVPGNLQNPVTMGPGNRYNGYVANVSDPNRVGPEQAYSLAQQAAPDNSRYNNPMGDEARFSPGSAIMSQANAIAAGRASSTGPNATTYELPQGYGKVPVYNPLRPAPEVQYRDNGRGQQVSYIPQNGPGIDPVLARQNAALKNRGSEAWQTDRRQKAENRGERRATEKSRRDEVKFKHMVSRGMNPMSPQAKALFPAQTGASVGGQQMALGNPITGDKGSVSSAAAAAGRANGRAQGSPVLVGIGYEPGSGVGGLHAAVDGYLTGNPDAKLSDSDIRELQAQLLDEVEAQGETAAFSPGNFSSLAGISTQGEEIGSFYADLWKQLASAGDNPKDRAAWADKYYRRREDLDRRMIDAFGNPSGA